MKIRIEQRGDKFYIMMYKKFLCFRWWGGCYNHSDMVSIEISFHSLKEAEEAVDRWYGKSSLRKVVKEITV